MSDTEQNKARVGLTRHLFQNFSFLIWSKLGCPMLAVVRIVESFVWAFFINLAYALVVRAVFGDAIMWMQVNLRSFST